MVVPARLTRIILIFSLFLPFAIVPPPASADEPGVTYSVSSGVSNSDEDYVREGISLAFSYLDEAYQTDLGTNLVVNVRDTAHPTDPGILAFANGEYLVVFTGSPSWDYMAPALRLEVIVHEFVHIFQYEQGGEASYDVPMWFIEGMAEYVAFDVVQRLNVISPAAVFDEQAWSVNQVGNNLPTLDEIEDIDDYQSSSGPVYSLSYLAVSRLVDRTSLGHLRLFLQTMRTAATWQSAFQSVFGIAPADFYQEFEQWLAEDLFAPARQPAPFAPLSSEGVDADARFVASPESAEAGKQLVVIAATKPNASCRIELRDGNGNRVDRIETMADGTGLVFWLDTVPDEIAGGEATYVIGCGGERDRIGIPIVG